MKRSHILTVTTIRKSNGAFTTEGVLVMYCCTRCEVVHGCLVGTFENLNSEQTVARQRLGRDTHEYRNIQS
jgi:hypothetical protein